MSESKTRQKMSRRELREAVFKLMYISEFNTKEEIEEQIEVCMDTILTEVLEDMQSPPCKEDIDYIFGKYTDIKEKTNFLDDMLGKASEGWKTSRMSRVDLSILRVAVYEMICDEDIPVSVAINEAVDIAKKYGGDNSGSFINGILGKIAKEKGE